VDDIEGGKLATVRAEEQEATFEVWSGESDICHLSAGVRITIDGHPIMGDKKLLITEVEHRASQVVFGQGSDDTEQSYTNKWKAISSEKTFRPPRVTPRPRIYGLVHGIIQHDPVKEPGKYALIDAAGRYMVRFLFDTADHPGGKVSCPIRMAQPHAGPDYGHHFPLKPGIEVLVAFIDGDPDRPLIVGSVPNTVTSSPVDKDNAIMNRIKTTSGVIIEMKDI
jgi:type VI secretion system secreted protein VgrG